MGHRQSLMTPERQLRAQRAQQMSLIYTVMVCLVSLIFVQFLLLTVALEGYLGGRIEVALPTALVSGLCCAVAYWDGRCAAPVVQPSFHLFTPNSNATKRVEGRRSPDQRGSLLLLPSSCSFC